MSIEVIKPGLLTLLADLGRPGYAHLGIGRAGAFDPPALAIANALCGNPRTACALEITLLGPTLHFSTSARIAVTGAPLAMQIDGETVPAWAALDLPAGATLTLGAMPQGCRAYLAISGGIKVDPVLGSRGSDINSGIGPFGGRALRAGDMLPFAASGHTRRACAHPDWWLDPRPWFNTDVETPLRLLTGEQQDMLTEASLQDLFNDTFHVQPDSNRTGVRLRGPELALRAAIEMVSEGCVPGLLQLPPAGEPIAFGPECPVSGGYPQLGQIAAVDLPRLAQLRPGDVLRFAPCTLEAAWQALKKREHALRELETRIAARLPA
ncbi:MAG: biotin-dependent carboxyltransferase family protein [Gammaproteobacteria bacterium]